MFLNNFLREGLSLIWRENEQIIEFRKYSSIQKLCAGLGVPPGNYLRITPLDNSRSLLEGKSKVIYLNSSVCTTACELVGSFPLFLSSVREFKYWIVSSKIIIKNLFNKTTVNRKFWPTHQNLIQYFAYNLIFEFSSRKLKKRKAKLPT